MTLARRSRVILVVASVVTVIALAYWHSQRHARYVRAMAAERFNKFCEARSHYRFPRIVMSPNGTSTFYIDDENALLRSPQADALRVMGTTAALYLAREIRRGDSAWSRGYHRVYTNLPSGLRSIAPKPPASRMEIRQLAALALGALGSNAAPAVPAVIEALGDCPRFTLFIWTERLKRLPFQQGDFEPLLAELTRQGNTDKAVDVICALQLHTASSARILTNSLSLTNRPAKLKALSELATMSEYARLVVPALMRVTGEHGDQELRGRSALVIEKYGPAAAEAVPALIELLRDKDAELRYRAARALEAIGSQASNAAPALMQATNDSSLMVQRVAKRALDNLGK